MGWTTCCCARSLACAAIGCAASTKRSGDSGLPWMTPESTGKAQPLKATRVRAGVQEMHPALRSGPKADRRHAPLDPSPVETVEGLLEVQEHQDAWLLGGRQVADLLKVG